MRRLLVPITMTVLLSLTACAGQGGDHLMQNRSPSVLLTSYAIANGMAEHGLITKILQHQATRADIAKLIAIDHNTWIAIRQAAFTPTDDNFRAADDGILQILSYSTPVSQPAPKGDSKSASIP
ncbi:hypothetical protein C0V97_08250 [Asaia sp. W19]|uniref:hypothetical protein n=1 Tax=unclassified Asaia TaxID=2685023 RepID=UPI000F8DC93A|nr:hypothetical protein [Asaia sp. W19]RUT26043.1 hypothetical protein C0V97_08250 [Asaia sp. W19]